MRPVDGIFFQDVRQALPVHRLRSQFEDQVGQLFADGVDQGIGLCQVLSGSLRVALKEGDGRSQLKGSGQRLLLGAVVEVARQAVPFLGNSHRLALREQALQLLGHAVQALGHLADLVARGILDEL